MRLAGLVLMGVGCREAQSLDEVPVVGGSEEQRALVREELAAFERWVAPARVSLARVRFTEVSPDHVGEYRSATRTIALQPDLLAPAVRVVVRHELCHWLDRQEDLVPWAGGLFDAGVPLLGSGYPHEPRSRRGRGEVLAQLCEEGPHSAALVLDGCEDPADPTREDIAAWMLDHVWTAYTPLPVADAPRGRPVDVDVDVGDSSLVMVRGAEPAGVVRVETVDPDGRLRAGGIQVDVVTGTPTQGPLVLEPWVEDPELPAGVHTLLPLADHQIATLPDGRALAVVQVPGTLHVGDSRPRWLVRDEAGGWAASPICANHQLHAPFTAADELWAAWVDDGQLRWREW